MTPVELARMIQDDCQEDARKWEGKPMTGHNLATMHGESLAMISALARLVEGILDGEENHDRDPA